MIRIRTTLVLAASAAFVGALAGCMERAAPTSPAVGVAGHMRSLGCTTPTCGSLRYPTTAELMAIYTAIGEINAEADPECGYIKTAAENEVYMVYDEADGNWGDHHFSDDSFTPEQTHIRSSNFGAGQTKNTIIHELAHHIGWLTEQSADYYMELCQ